MAAAKMREPCCRCLVSRRVAKVLYPLLAFISVGICVIDGGMIGSFVVAGALLIRVILVFCPEKPDEAKQPVAADASPAAAATDAPTAKLQRRGSFGDDHHLEAAEQTTQLEGVQVQQVPGAAGGGGGGGGGGAKKPRLYYLDNLKVLLTIFVIVHHVTGGYGGEGWVFGIGKYLSYFKVFGTGVMLLNQAYFMPLFFFVSAYFTPTSCDRKGTKAFLDDKFKRLGLPFLVFVLLLGPLVDVMVVYLGAPVPGRQYSYFPNPIQSWFLAWLCILNCFHVWVVPDGQWRNVAAPSMCKLLLLGMGLGVLQAVQMIIAPGYVFIPVTFGSVPFDFVFFMGGVLAKRNGWLEDALPKISAGTRWLARGWTIFTILAVYITLIVVYDAGGGLFLPTWQCGIGWPPASSIEGMDTGLLLGGLLGAAIVLGAYCLSMAVTLLDLFQLHGNFSTKFTQYMADSAYAAYLIHAHVAVAVQISYNAILRAMGTEIVFDSITEWNERRQMDVTRYSNNSTTCVPEGALWAGWLYSSVLSVLLSFVIAHGIRKLPGLRNIL